MRVNVQTIGKLVFGAGMFTVLAAVLFTQLLRTREIDSVPDEHKIARTLEIIRTSSPKNPKVLKVLFYGQSITKSGWHETVVKHWHEKYPNTYFVVQNRAVGGFASQALVRTTQQDIAAFYPDLIVFHVYGDHRSYEEIIQLFRSQTTADIVVQTDHGVDLPDPPCATGLQLTLKLQPGCTMLFWGNQKKWEDEMSYHKIPALAKKYGLAVEPQRTWWRDYILSTGIEPKSLLADEIHPNQRGKELMATFFIRYFDGLIERWNGDLGKENVLTLSVSPALQMIGSASLSFTGSRLELISNKLLDRLPTVTIDGVSPNAIDGCYQVSRASSIETVPDWPALRRITLQKNRIAEDWTATLVKISADQTSFEFDVKSSITGYEGHGDSLHDFVSNSGRISIESQDWMLKRAADLTHVLLAEPFDVNWSVKNVCQGPPEYIDRGDHGAEYRYVLATGLVNRSHDASLAMAVTDSSGLIEIRAYRPPLKL